MPFPDLVERVASVRQRIDAAIARRRVGVASGQQVTLVAVTKTYGPDAVRAVCDAGVRDCGENRVQEAVSKMAVAGDSVRWHLIGHLQRNKVKLAEGFTLVQSLDGERLADALHQLGTQRGRPVDVLVQVNSSGEASKGGYDAGALMSEARRLRSLDGIRVLGVMTMAPLDADEAMLRRTFAGARTARERLTEAGHPATELSMGMSNDFEIAVEEGATMVRLGTVLFGARRA